MSNSDRPLIQGCCISSLPVLRRNLLLLSSCFDVTFTVPLRRLNLSIELNSGIRFLSGVNSSSVLHIIQTDLAQVPPAQWAPSSEVKSPGNRCGKVKINFTLVQTLRLCTGPTVHRRRRGIALLFLDHGIRRGEWSESRLGRSLPPGKNTVPIVQGAGWAPGPVWTGAENLSPAGIRSTDRPASSKSLYRLSYPAPQLWG